MTDTRDDGGPASERAQFTAEIKERWGQRTGRTRAVLVDYEVAFRWWRAHKAADAMLRARKEQP